MIAATLSEAKSYDCEYFDRALGHERIAWQFHEFRLGAQTAKEFGLAAVRVPAYPPHAVAERTIDVLLIFPNMLIILHQAFLTREVLGGIAHVTIENILSWTPASCH